MDNIKKGAAKKAAPKAEKKPAKAKSDETAVAKTEAAASEAKAARGPLAKDAGGEAYRILLKPVLTEKSSNLAALNQYVFSVAVGATKVDVARAITALYGVKPASVRVIKSEGKYVRFGRFSGKEKDEKKAIVTLKKGETLSVL